MNLENAYYIGGFHALALYLSPKVKEIDKAFEAKMAKEASPRQDSNFMAYLDGQAKRLPTQTLPADYIPRASRQDALKLRKFFGMDLPLSICVPTCESRRCSAFFQSILHAPAIPRANYIQVAKNLFVASPELATLQVSSLVEPIDLIVLMSMLCAIYCLDPDSPGGLSPRRQVTTIESFQEFLNSFAVDSRKPKGAPAMSRALCHVRSQAASPAEINLGLRMSLPQSMAGYGFEELAHNAKVDVSNAFALGGVHYRHPDFLWAEKKICCEYQSDAEHGDKASYRNDRLRIDELSGAGYKVYELVSTHLMNVRDMDVMAHRIGSDLNARPFKTDADAIARREALRSDIARALDHFGKLWI